MHTPGSNSSREGIEASAEGTRKGRSPEALISAMMPVLSHGDRQAAKVLIREVEREHAGNASLALAVSRCKTLVSRGQWFEAALEAMRRDLQEDRFTDAIGHFREVMNLSRGLKLLRAEADAAAQDEARKLLPRNWRVAQVILQEATAAEPVVRTDSELQKKLRRAREEEALTHAIFQADRANLEGKAEQAHAKLTQLLALHPGDSRIKERISAMDHPAQIMEAAETSAAAPTVEATPTGAKIQNTPGLPESKLDQKDTPTEIEEGRDGALPAETLIAQSACVSIKNFSALAAATAMLGVAGFLVWYHFAQPYADVNRGNQSRAGVPAVLVSPVVQKPAAVEALKAVTPDEEAWLLVKGSDDEGMIREFLASYPASPHALRAKVKLSSMDWAKVDKGHVQAVQGYLKQHPRSALPGAGRGFDFRHAAKDGR